MAASLPGAEDTIPNGGGCKSTLTLPWSSAQPIHWAAANSGLGQRNFNVVELSRSCSGSFLTGCLGGRLVAFEMRSHFQAPWSIASTRGTAGTAGAG